MNLALRFFFMQHATPSISWWLIHNDHQLPHLTHQTDYSNSPFQGYNNLTASLLRSQQANHQSYCPLHTYTHPSTPTFFLDCWTLEHETDTLFNNTDNEQPTYAIEYPWRAKTSILFQLIQTHGSLTACLLCIRITIFSLYRMHFSSSFLTLQSTPFWYNVLLFVITLNFWMQRWIFGYILYKHHARAIHLNHQIPYKSLVVWHVPFWAGSDTITF
jgi:hypothetical protein